MKVENLFVASPFIDTSADGWKNKQKHLTPVRIFSFSMINKLLMASLRKKIMKEEFEETMEEIWFYPIIQSTPVIYSPSRRL